MSTQQRTQILDAYKSRIWRLYNSTNGTELKLFRAGRRGQYQRAEVFPSFIVMDSGQRKGATSGNESESRILSVRIFFQIEGNWDRVQDVQDWTDRVDAIERNLRGRPGYGIETIRYVGDDPWEVEFQSGGTEALWTLDHEVEYCVEVNEFAAW